MRKLLSVCISLFLLSIALPVWGQSQDKTPRYEALLKRVKGGDMTVNFQELRLAYTETPQYKPYGGIKTEVLKPMFTSVKDKKYKEAIGYAEQVLAENYVDIDAHFVSSIAYAALGDKDKGTFHQDIAHGLLKSISNSGTGKSPETAFTVISVDEEYALLNVLRMKTSSQKALDVNGHNYDEMTVTDSQTNQTLVLYFCIDKPYKWLHEALSKPRKRE